MPHLLLVSDIQVFSKDKALQPAADLGRRSILVRTRRLCVLSACRVQRSAKMMGVTTSVLPLRKVQCRKMTWQQLHARLVASESRASLGFALPSPDFLGL